MPSLLVSYGKLAHVGRFAWSAPVVRHASLVIQSPRGIELGTVLGVADERFEFGRQPADGDALRIATLQDQFQAEQNTAFAREILDAADAALMPVAFLDCEITLDRRGAILHAVPWEICNLDELLAALSDQFNVAVRLLDVSRTPTLTDPPEPKSSCGSGDCGSKEGGCGAGGGCSTGSCSKGQVKNAAQLTDYFADLRTKMEAGARQPLN